MGYGTGNEAKGRSLDFLPLLGLEAPISGAQHVQVESQPFREEMGSLLPALPTAPAACSTLLVSAQMMKQMQGRNLLDFVFRLGLSFELS